MSSKSMRVLHNRTTSIELAEKQSFLTNRKIALEKIKRGLDELWMNEEVQYLSGLGGVDEWWCGELQHLADTLNVRLCQVEASIAFCTPLDQVTHKQEKLASKCEWVSKIGNGVGGDDTFYFQFVERTSKNVLSVV